MMASPPPTYVICSIFVNLNGFSVTSCLFLLKLAARWLAYFLATYPSYGRGMSMLIAQSPMAKMLWCGYRSLSHGLRRRKLLSTKSLPFWNANSSGYCLSELTNGTGCTPVDHMTIPLGMISPSANSTSPCLTSLTATPSFKLKSRLTIRFSAYSCS